MITLQSQNSPNFASTLCRLYAIFICYVDILSSWLLWGFLPEKLQVCTLKIRAIHSSSKNRRKAPVTSSFSFEFLNGPVGGLIQINKREKIGKFAQQGACV